MWVGGTPRWRGDVLYTSVLLLVFVFYFRAPPQAPERLFPLAGLCLASLRQLTTPDRTLYVAIIGEATTRYSVY